MVTWRNKMHQHNTSCLQSERLGEENIESNRLILQLRNLQELERVLCQASMTRAEAVAQRHWTHSTAARSGLSLNQNSRWFFGGEVNLRSWQCPATNQLRCDENHPVTTNHDTGFFWGFWVPWHRQVIHVVWTSAKLRYGGCDLVPIWVWKVFVLVSYKYIDGETCCFQYL